MLLATILQYPNAALATTSQNDNQQFPPSIIAASSTDTTPHALKLKAIQQGDAEPRRVSGFKVDLTNVVTAQINSQILVFVTDNSVRVLEAKVRTVSDQLIDLIPSTTTQANAFSLVNLPVGVYTLDIITQKGNAKAAYEGILVISQQPTTIINETTKQIINQEINQNSRVDIDTRIIFKKPPVNSCGCPIGWDCPDVDCPDPCDVSDPPPECGEEQPGLFENGEELGNEEELRNGEEPEQPDEEEEEEEEEEQEEEEEEEQGR